MMLVPFILLMAASLLWGCQLPGRPLGGYSRADLAQLPEAHLRYPGAVLLGHSGTEPKRTIEGPLYAEDGSAYGSSATAMEIQAYYGRELGVRGWQAAPENSVRSTTETRAVAWRKGDLIFHLGVKQKNNPQVPREWDTYSTAYEVAVIVSPLGR